MRFMEVALLSVFTLCASMGALAQSPEKSAEKMSCTILDSTGPRGSLTVTVFMQSNSRSITISEGDIHEAHYRPVNLTELAFDTRDELQNKQFCRFGEQYSHSVPNCQLSTRRLEDNSCEYKLTYAENGAQKVLVGDRSKALTALFDFENDKRENVCEFIYEENVSCGLYH